MGKNNFNFPSSPSGERRKIKGPFTCYTLRHSHKGVTYTGQTNNFKRRLRQHNGELKGGARYTRMHKGTGTWSPLFRVKGFRTIGDVLRFERAMKKHGKGPGPRGRVRQLEFLLSASRTNLTIKVHCSQQEYLELAGMTPEEYLVRREKNKQKDNVTFIFK